MNDISRNVVAAAVYVAVKTEYSFLVFVSV